ncbi:MAG: hypothetical protein AB8E87_14900 [Prochlorococcus sp.]
MGDAKRRAQQPNRSTPENMRNFHFNPEQLRDMHPHQRDCALSRCLLASNLITCWDEQGFGLTISISS